MAARWNYLVDVAEGVEEFARDELAGLALATRPARGGLLVALAGPPQGLLVARTIGAAYRRELFDVPRPKALLGSEHLRRLVEVVSAVIRDSSEGFTALRMAAAGADSSVFLRLADALASAVGLGVDRTDGDLLVRVRPADGGWEVLVRLTPRPLSTRPWRVCNLPGGINATVAVVMNRLAGEEPGDRYLNLMCGTGTLAIERALSRVPVAESLGVDSAQRALDCALENEAAAGAQGRRGRQGTKRLPPVRWLRGDVRTLDLEERFDVVTADAPWGDAVGEHADNEALHAALLECAARHTVSGARFALLSHEVKIVRRCVAGSDRWHERRSLRVSHGGHRPLLTLLERV